jgi:hypothetical protein
MEKSKNEAEYWRDQHPNQPYTDKSKAFEHYEHAYRTGYEGAAKHSGKSFEEMEKDVAVEYEKGRPDDALPWDHVRPAVKAAWDRIGGVISPRDPDRGIRSGI